MKQVKADVVFMGSPDFAVPSLNALYESGAYRPILVISQPDRPRGRGRLHSPTPVRRRAQELGLNNEVMSRENYAEVVVDIAALKPDFVVVTAFGIIVRRDLLDLPRRGCVNLHASILPRYRGVSPIQAAIMAGDKTTGCTTMMMDEGIDTGDILLWQSLAIKPSDNAGTLTDRLATMGAGLLVRTLDGLVDGSVRPQPQIADDSPYTRKIRKSHGRIDWTRPAAELHLRIRAMSPWPSAYSFLAGRRLIVVESTVVPDSAGNPGEVLSLSPLRVACGEGALDLKRIKPEGKRAMTPSEYLAGHPVAIGARFEDSV